LWVGTTGALTVLRISYEERKSPLGAIVETKHMHCGLLSKNKCVLQACVWPYQLDTIAFSPLVVTAIIAVEMSITQLTTRKELFI